LTKIAHILVSAAIKKKEPYPSRLIY